ncbi:MAG: lysylphosphatidylglycerol synthase transmembrane domain-containing protein [Gallionellaceae bacterium]|jgi:uncharacterized protein (TIRG00374 family)
MLKLIVKILITLAILFVIARNIDLAAVLNVVRGMQTKYLLLALLMQLLSAAIASYRWYLIMQRLNFKQGPMFFLQSYLKGSFFNQALPGGIGGDAYRVLECSKLQNSRKPAFYGVLLDRILGLIGILLLNLIANIAYPDLLPAAIFHLLNVIALGGITAVIVFAMLGKIDRFATYKFTRHLHEISADLRRVYHDPKAIALHSVISVLIHFVSMLAVYFLGIGVGLNYGLLTFLVLVPPVMLLTIAPISLAGWGVREGGMIGLFMLVGADKTLVLSMSVLYGLILIAASLPGLYLFLMSRHKE